MIKNFNKSSNDFYKFKKYVYLNSNNKNDKSIKNKLKYYYGKLKLSNNQLGGSNGELGNDLTDFIYDKFLSKIDSLDYNYINDLAIISRQNYLFKNLKEKFLQSDNNLINEIMNKNNWENKFTLDINDVNLQKKSLICAFMISLLTSDIEINEDFVNSKSFINIIDSNNLEKNDDENEDENDDKNEDENDYENEDENEDENDDKNEDENDDENDDENEDENEPNINQFSEGGSDENDQILDKSISEGGSDENDNYDSPPVEGILRQIQEQKTITENDYLVSNNNQIKKKKKNLKF